MNKIQKINSVFAIREASRMQKNLSIKKVCLLISVSFFSLSSPAVSGGDTPSPYANVFNEEIYDQSELKRHCKRVWQDPKSKKWSNPKTLDSKNLNRAVLELLFSKKLKLLEDKLFTKFDGELNELKLLIENNKPSTGGKVLNLAGSTLSTVGSFALLGVPGAAATRFAIGGMAGASAAGGIMKGIHDFLQPDELVDLEKAKSAIERTKRELITDLHKEPISDLEIAYVFRKRFYTPELAKKIEIALLMTRRDGGLPLDFSIAFLDNCLNLPIQKKRINPRSSWLCLENDIGLSPKLETSPLTDKQQKARENLLSYHPDTRKALQEITMQTACTSTAEESSYRRFYFLSGAPGFGKTTATRSILELLELPYYEMNIRTSADISQRSLEGGDWQRQLAEPGHIAHALLSGVESENKRNKYVTTTVPIAASKYGLPSELKVRTQMTNANGTYKNSALIINDFDRLLLDPNTSTQILAFLLDYLDPEKKSFYSPYFGSQIDTSELIIFITGNNPIPKEQRFDALRDRCVEIEFQEFEDKIRTEILSSFIKRKFPIYQLNESPKGINHLLSCVQDISSLRSAKKHIEKEMIAMMLRGEDISIDTSTMSNESESLDLNDEFSLNWGSTVSPPSFVDSDVYKDAKTLNKLSELTRDLSSDRQETQLTALTTLLGQYYSVWPNASGEIKSLWSTTRITWSYSSNAEAEDNLGALLNRLRRYKTPQQKQAVLQFHTDLVKALTETLLSFEKKASDEKFFIYENIKNDNVKLNNIKNLANHLDLIGNIGDVWEGEKLDKKSKRLLDSYRSWLGNTGDKNYKVNLLLAHYNLLPTVSIVPTATIGSSSESDEASSEIPSDPGSGLDLSKL